MISYWDEGGSRTLWQLPDGCAPRLPRMLVRLAPLATHTDLHVASSHMLVHNQINCVLNEFERLHTYAN